MRSGGDAEADQHGADVISGPEYVVASTVGSIDESAGGLFVSTFTRWWAAAARSLCWISGGWELHYV